MCDNCIDLKEHGGEGREGGRGREPPEDRNSVWEAWICRCIVHRVSLFGA